MPKNELGIYRDGLYRRHLSSKLSSGTTGIDLDAEDSGTIFFLNTATTQYYYLPRISSLALGVVFEFVIQEQASSDDIKISCVKHDSSALIQSAFSSIVDNTSRVSPGSTFFTGGRFTAVSSVVWMLEQITAMGYSYTSAATGAMGGWSTA